MRSNNSLIIPYETYNQMITHTKKCLPYESCGLLTGKRNDIRSVWELENELKSSTRFFVDKKAVEETLEKVSEMNEEVIAIYHSHPNTSPVPSSYDLASHVDPLVKMVIVSHKEKVPLVKCYQITRHRYTICPLLVHPIQ
ncbi:M67 family metallopeptidase [Halobacillus sp. A1]|nr:M67 family metallopeptidase [Halobacillus sp. A1]MCP3030152.1 M67 family metallopeptidase [Halobacillus sp. A1]